MKNANKKETSSSENSQTLKIDFYESGIGDTTIVTFPSGGIAIVDAHPSQHDHRPDIRKIAEGRTIHFVCLTHPHADHGADLIPLLEEHPAVGEFWSTLHDVPSLLYGIQEMRNFPSPVKEFASQLNHVWANFFLDLLGAVAKRKIPRHLLRSDQRKKTIDGVDIHCIAPDESIQNSYFDSYRESLKDSNKKFPDPNSLSAVLVLRFGESVVLLGADALRKNWDSAVINYRGRNLPNAHVLKVPHHGAKNTFNFGHNAQTYLDLCLPNKQSKAVLFAGDSKHPAVDVYSKVCEYSELYCLSNGTRRQVGDSNPLRIGILGAQAVRTVPTCNPAVSFELDRNGNVNVLSGRNCEACPLAELHGTTS